MPQRTTTLLKVYTTKSTCGFAVLSTHLNESGLANGDAYYFGDFLPPELLDHKKKWNVKITIEAEEIK